MIEDINDKLNGLQELIDKRIKDIDVTGSFIAKNTATINYLELDLNEVEFDIRNTSNWTELGLKNKEERELYVKTRDEYKAILFEIQSIENDLIEYKHILSVLEKELKFYNRLYDRYSNLERQLGDSCGNCEK